MPQKQAAVMYENIFTVQHGRNCCKGSCFREETSDCCDPIQKAGSVSHFFGVKSEITPGLFSSGNLEEPSTLFIHDAEDNCMESKSSNNT